MTAVDEAALLGAALAGGVRCVGSVHSTIVSI